MVAVHGSGYCTSAFHAAKLILNNILRIAAVNTVGDALIWVGKVCREYPNSASSLLGFVSSGCIAHIFDIKLYASHVFRAACTACL